MHKRIETVISLLGVAGLVFLFVYGLSTDQFLTLKTVMLYMVIVPAAVMCGAHAAHLTGRIDFECKFGVVIMAAGASFFLLACASDTTSAFDRGFMQFIACVALLVVAAGAWHMWQVPASRRIRA